MGQYYLYANMDTKQSLFGDDGMKFMEHTYLGSGVMDMLFSSVYEKPQRIMQVGDYADRLSEFVGCDLMEGFEDELGIRSDIYDEHGYHTTMYGYFRRHEIIYDGEEIPYIRYAYNDTKKQMVDLYRQKPCSAYIDFIESENRAVLHISKIHTAGMLIALGNGLGGGDYHFNGQNANMVGIWCGDRIFTSNELKPDFYDITEDVIFDEYAENMSLEEILDEEMNRCKNSYYYDSRHEEMLKNFTVDTRGLSEEDIIICEDFVKGVSSSLIQSQSPEDEMEGECQETDERE
ncbi:MAG: hypothetical protein HUJ53_05780 [Holdemanella sp.]|nr:hypothetical protein [Holdemanella sp.]